MTLLPPAPIWKLSVHPVEALERFDSPRSPSAPVTRWAAKVHPDKPTTPHARSLGIRLREPETQFFIQSLNHRGGIQHQLFVGGGRINWKPTTTPVASRPSSTFLPASTGVFGGLFAASRAKAVEEEPETASIGGILKRPQAIRIGSHAPRWDGGLWVGAVTGLPQLAPSAPRAHCKADCPNSTACRLCSGLQGPTRAPMPVIANSTRSRDGPSSGLVPLFDEHMGINATKPKPEMAARRGPHQTAGEYPRFRLTRTCSDHQ